MITEKYISLLLVSVIRSADVDDPKKLGTIYNWAWHWTWFCRKTEILWTVDCSPPIWDNVILVLLCWCTFTT